MAKKPLDYNPQMDSDLACRVYFQPKYDDKMTISINFMFIGTANYDADIIGANNLDMTLEMVMEEHAHHQEVTIYTNKFAYHFYLMAYGPYDYREELEFIRSRKWMPKGEWIAGFVLTARFYGQTPLKYILPKWMDLNEHQTKDVRITIDNEAAYRAQVEIEQP